VNPAHVVAEPGPAIAAPRVVPATVPVVAAGPRRAHVAVIRLPAASTRVDFDPIRFAFVILAKEAIFAIRSIVTFFAFSAVLAMPHEARATVAHAFRVPRAPAPRRSISETTGPCTIPTGKRLTSKK